MKTRIISGIVMGVIVAAVLLLGFYVSPLFVTAAIAVLAAAAAYELCHNAAGIKSKAAWIGACVYVFLGVFNMHLSDINYSMYIDVKPSTFLSDRMGLWATGLFYLMVLTVIYFVYAGFMVLKSHKEMTLGTIGMLCAMPIVIAVAFSCLGGIINSENGIYYLLLLLNFSSICDMGAYFVGVTMGKHKLCPEISPKKTVEGAIGGIVSSIVFSVIFVFVFGHSDKLIPTLILTIPLCIVGMMGDLFASSIKRSVGLKDYSNLIPGHGGILDRVDSILMIAPVLYLFVLFGVL